MFESQREVPVQRHNWDFGALQAEDVRAIRIGGAGPSKASRDERGQLIVIRVTRILGGIMRRFGGAVAIAVVLVSLLAVGGPASASANPSVRVARPPAMKVGSAWVLWYGQSWCSPFNILKHHMFDFDWNGQVGGTFELSHARKSLYLDFSNPESGWEFYATWSPKNPEAYYGTLPPTEEEVYIEPGVCAS